MGQTNTRSIRRVRVQLLGLDKGWVGLASENNSIYGNLAPGIVVELQGNPTVRDGQGRPLQQWDFFFQWDAVA